MTLIELGCKIQEPENFSPQLLKALFIILVIFCLLICFFILEFYDKDNVYKHNSFLFLMKKDDYYNFYHVDISTQIDNKWKEDTILGIVRNSERYSIKIKARDKLEIKRRFIREENSRSSRIHNKKVIAIIYSYLLYKALCEFDAKPLLLCRDVRPEKFVTNYLQKIASFFKNYRVLDRKIKFRKRIEFGVKEKLPKSLAGKYTRKVYQGKLPATKIINVIEVEELINLVGKLL